MAVTLNSTLQSCSTALDRCILELKVQLDALIERREYTSVEKVAGIIASVGQCRDQLVQSSDDMGGKSAGPLTEVGRPLSAKLSKSHEQVPLGPRVIAQSTKASFICTDDELLKKGKTKDNGTYTHRIPWPNVTLVLAAMLDKRNDWRVTDLCKFANDPKRVRFAEAKSLGLVKETQVYLVLGLLSAFGGCVQKGAERGMYQIKNKSRIEEIRDLLMHSPSTESIGTWFTKNQSEDSWAKSGK